MYFDFWYNDKLTDVDAISVFFVPDCGVYRGNMYKAGRMVGDFVTSDSLQIEKYFGRVFE